MKKYYFTFDCGIAPNRNCYHVEEAESYEKARNAMNEMFDNSWDFQYSEEEWLIGEDEYKSMGYTKPWSPGLTQADLFNLTEI